MVDSVKKLLERNKQWVEEVNQHDAEFFNRLAEGQTPEFLWVGCSDSRVPAEQITSSQPGSIFVHRNIANMVIHTDANLLSVVNFAVLNLKVKHIIVCGHYDCGGIAAAMSNVQHGFIDNWLTHIKDIYYLHRDELDSIPDNHAKARRFAELNVIEQAYNIAKISFVQDAWRQGPFPHIHSLIYDVADGKLTQLINPISSTDVLSPIFTRQRLAS